MPLKKIPRTRISIFFDNGGTQDYLIDPRTDSFAMTVKEYIIKRAEPRTTITIERKKTTHRIVTEMLLDAAEVELQKRVLAGVEEDTSGPELR